METIIKKIRQAAGMSQQDFADTLGTSFSTVNRWENGRSTPGKLAQKTLYDLCVERDIPVYDLIHEKIRSLTDSANIQSERLILYHGSKSGIQGRIEPRSRDKCDFGRGFYMGTEPDQPLTLISDFDESKFYIVSIDLSDLETLTVEPNLEWAMLVAFNRGKMEHIKGSKLYDTYEKKAKCADIVIGSIANDRMFYVLDNFFMGNITDKALIMSLSALQLGKQYVAVTQKGCDAVRIEAEIPLSHLERQIMKDLSEGNRIKGVNLANDICRNYRREGLFFDEIIEGGD